MDRSLIKKLVKPADTKIVMLVIDGVGGVEREPGGETELGTAKTPNLNELASGSICGLHEPIGPGITPGSGPAHLSVFGYDPIEHQVGRGVLSALGVGFDVQPGDIAARGNFCTVDKDGKVTDRRAGRIPTDVCKELCEKLKDITIPGVEIFVGPVKDYRFLFVIRGCDASYEVADTDPQETGKEPLDPQPLCPEAQTTADVAKEFIKQAGDILRDSSPANMVLLRGFSHMPNWDQFPDLFGLKAAAIAGYPMYRGVAKLIGMEVLDATDKPEEEIQVLKEKWDEYDFFYIHIKPTDSAGEDGDFDRKVSVIEMVDSLVPKITSLNPDVLIVTGDHSTPAVLEYHSWHPVPVMIWSKHCRADSVQVFSEKACVQGGLGARFPAVEIMPIALANAMRLQKFGA
jgi:2,3-bisphosphoglycerate-independent phosphoglycerate mutase